MPATIRGGLIITEILPDPRHTNEDINGDGIVDLSDTFVEFYNNSNTAIDIGGLELWSQSDGAWFTFPAGTMLQPEAVAIVMQGYGGGSGPTLPGANDIAFEAGAFLGFDYHNDSVVVYDRSADNYIRADYGNGATNYDPTGWSDSVKGDFPSTATIIGTAENFGPTTRTQSVQRSESDLNSFLSGPVDLGFEKTSVCFADGTLIRTDRGDVPVEHLTKGDLVITMEGGAEPIHWVGGRRLSPEELTAKPNLWPIKIRAGALGPNLPARDLVVSPQHRILLSNPVVERMFGARQAMVAAKHLQGLAGVERFCPSGGVSYLHIMLPQHRTLFAEQAPAESLFLGPQARKSLPEAALHEMAEIFPDLLRGESQMAPAREFIKAKQARKLTERLVKNKKQAVADRV